MAAAFLGAAFLVAVFLTAAFFGASVLVLVTRPEAVFLSTVSFSTTAGAYSLLLVMFMCDCMEHSPLTSLGVVAFFALVTVAFFSFGLVAAFGLATAFFGATAFFSLVAVASAGFFSLVAVAFLTAVFLTAAFFSVAFFGAFSAGVFLAFGASLTVPEEPGKEGLDIERAGMR